jgi:hypothetical protein
MAEINLKTLSAGVSEIDVNFNGTLEGVADATLPINVNLTDGVGDVTPTSVALTGNDLDILIPPAVVPSGVLFKTIEPSQYTSYRTGDEGWRVQNGWFDYTPPTNPAAVAELDFTSANFNFVLKNPLIVNGVSSTTRFVDVNGIQTFSSTGNANQVVIDKLLGKMYTRQQISKTSWNNSIDDALSFSIVVNSITYDDWYLISFNEINNIFQKGWTIQDNFAFKDAITTATILVTGGTFSTSTTYRSTTTSNWRLAAFAETWGVSAKTIGAEVVYIRDCKNLITAP